MSEQPAGQKTEGGAAASGAGGFSTAVIIEFVCCFLGLQVSYLGTFHEVTFLRFLSFFLS